MRCSRSQKLAAKRVSQYDDGGSSHQLRSGIMKLWRILAAIAAVTWGIGMNTTNGEERLVFISAFASGDNGAIHAYQLDLDTGKLKLVERTTGAEHPFYLALAPNRKHLYSIHAKQFGGKEPEQVAAYEITSPTGQLKLL